jgi:hypothetical protein
MPNEAPANVTYSHAFMDYLLAEATRTNRTPTEVFEAELAAYCELRNEGRWPAKLEDWPTEPGLWEQRTPSVGRRYAYACTQAGQIALEFFGLGGTLRRVSADEHLIGNWRRLPAASDAEVDALECTLSDEEAAHQDTLRLLQARDATIAELEKKSVRQHDLWEAAISTIAEQDAEIERLRKRVAELEEVWGKLKKLTLKVAKERNDIRCKLTAAEGERDKLAKELAARDARIVEQDVEIERLGFWFAKAKSDLAATEAELAEAKIIATENAAECSRLREEAAAATERGDRLAERLGERVEYWDRYIAWLENKIRSTACVDPLMSGISMAYNRAMEDEAALATPGAATQPVPDESRCPSCRSEMTTAKGPTCSWECGSQRDEWRFHQSEECQTRRAIMLGAEPSTAPVANEVPGRPLPVWLKELEEFVVYWKSMGGREGGSDDDKEAGT